MSLWCVSSLDTEVRIAASNGDLTMNTHHVVVAIITNLVRK